MMQICYTFNDVISCGKDIFVQMKSHLIKSELQNFRMTFQNARFLIWCMVDVEVPDELYNRCSK